MTLAAALATLAGLAAAPAHATVPGKNGRLVFQRPIALLGVASHENTNGCPSISVPAGFTRDGLPVGLMLSARPFDEPRLLGLAHAYQEATRFGERRPLEPAGAPTEAAR